MKTADKALKLLDYFTESQPEHGLSDLARLSAIDKATTHRLLKTLQKHGFVEQHPASRKYSLGASLLRLAHIRESTAPVTSIVDPILAKLVDETGETGHASLIAGSSLATIGIRACTKSTRVNLEPGQKLPLHATASGISYLAFSPDKLVEDFLNKKLDRFTEMTTVDPDRVRELVAETRADGCSLIDQGYEDDVVGIAAPIFDLSGYANGAVAVATPSSRMNAAVKRINCTAVIRAAVEITRGMGAKPHPALLEKIGTEAA